MILFEPDSRIASYPEKVIVTLKKDLSFKLFQKFSFDLFFDMRDSYGHFVNQWKDTNVPFCFAILNRRVIINSESTWLMLKRVFFFLAQTSFSYRNFNILFVSGLPSSVSFESFFSFHKETMPLLGHGFMIHWLNGLLTNMNVMLKTFFGYNIASTFAHTFRYKKAIKREWFLTVYKGLRVFERFPDFFCFFSVAGVYKTALAEAKKLKLPIIAFVDSDCEVSDIAFPIMSNDDSAIGLEIKILLFRELLVRIAKKKLFKEIQELILENKSVKAMVLNEFFDQLNMNVKNEQNVKFLDKPKKEVNKSFVYFIEKINFVVNLFFKNYYLLEKNNIFDKNNFYCFIENLNKQNLVFLNNFCYKNLFKAFENKQEKVKANNLFINFLKKRVIESKIVSQDFFPLNFKGKNKKKFQLQINKKIDKKKIIYFLSQLKYALVFNNFLSFFFHKQYFFDFIFYSLEFSKQNINLFFSKRPFLKNLLTIFSYVLVKNTKVTYFFKYRFFLFGKKMIFKKYHLVFQKKFCNISLEKYSKKTQFCKNINKSFKYFFVEFNKMYFGSTSKKIKNKQREISKVKKVKKSKIKFKKHKELKLKGNLIFGNLNLLIFSAILKRKFKRLKIRVKRSLQRKLNFKNFSKFKLIKYSRILRLFSGLGGFLYKKKNFMYFFSRRLNLNKKLKTKHLGKVNFLKRFKINEISFKRSRKPRIRYKKNYPFFFRFKIKVKKNKMLSKFSKFLVKQRQYIRKKIVLSSVRKKGISKKFLKNLMLKTNNGVFLDESIRRIVLDFVNDFTRYKKKKIYRTNFVANYINTNKNYFLRTYKGLIKPENLLYSDRSKKSRFRIYKKVFSFVFFRVLNKFFKKKYYKKFSFQKFLLYFRIKKKTLRNKILFLIKLLNAIIKISGFDLKGFYYFRLKQVKNYLQKNFLKSKSVLNWSFIKKKSKLLKKKERYVKNFLTYMVKPYNKKKKIRLIPEEMYRRYYRQFFFLRKKIARLFPVFKFHLGLRKNNFVKEIIKFRKTWFIKNFQVKILWDNFLILLYKQIKNKKFQYLFFRFKNIKLNIKKAIILKKVLNKILSKMFQLIYFEFIFFRKMNFLHAINLNFFPFMLLRGLAFVYKRFNLMLGFVIKKDVFINLNFFYIFDNVPLIVLKLLLKFDFIYNLSLFVQKKYTSLLKVTKVFSIFSVVKFVKKGVFDLNEHIKRIKKFISDMENVGEFKNGILDIGLFFLKIHQTLFLVFNRKFLNFRNWSFKGSSQMNNLKHSVLGLSCFKENITKKNMLLFFLYNKKLNKNRKSFFFNFSKKYTKEKKFLLKNKKQIRLLSIFSNEGV